MTTKYNDGKYMIVLSEEELQDERIVGFNGSTLTVKRNTEDSKWIGSAYNAIRSTMVYMGESSAVGRKRAAAEIAGQVGR